jgi:dTDP-4-amino-4,6-dideoxygalactose transaminase
VIAALDAVGVRAARPVTRWHEGAGCPHADDAFAHVVSIPLYPSLTGVEQERVIAGVDAALTALEHHR